MVNLWLLRLVSSDSNFKLFIILMSHWLFCRTCGMQTEQHVAGPVPIYLAEHN